MATDFIMPRLPDQQQPYGAHFYPHLAQQTTQYTPQVHSNGPSPAHSRSHSQTQTQAQTQAQTQSQPQSQSQSPTQSQHQQPLGTNSRQISPLSTSNTPSPTSPKSYHGRQLRPLYIPAVLRPTDYPSKKTPTTKKSDDQDDDSLKASSSWSSLTGLGAFGRLSRRSTGDSGKCVDGDWNLDHFPKPTAEPTREHWKPDTESAICDEPSCMRHFNYWTRRHHCRKCGNIFCDTHSAFDVPLDQDANYNPRGTVSRACSHCHTEFQFWRSRTNSQASSDDSSTRGAQTAPASPVGTSTPTAAKKGQAEVAASVPRDWNWSTF
ncbi:uncharacterized protein JN550_000376 [Neoarthrinium moseri]|uniref:uncharacterized protein n=1 Tax=Neoarthrinium moseri TaxID=1658444 RepID=UPI001FDCE53D|nr:uncharacterized protein JN550_000376 [Neoarthrinium moseri]KAI1878194.1 hypothetical protein JN550_000376 [Neoarthrinium moseri]